MESSASWAGRKLIQPFFPVVILVHASLRLRNMKNRLENKIEGVGMKKSPMGIILDLLDQQEEKINKIQDFLESKLNKEWGERAKMAPSFNSTWFAFSFNTKIKCWFLPRIMSVLSHSLHLSFSLHFVILNEHFFYTFCVKVPDFFRAFQKDLYSPVWIICWGGEGTRHNEMRHECFCIFAQ